MFVVCHALFGKFRSDFRELLLHPLQVNTKSRYKEFLEEYIVWVPSQLFFSLRDFIIFSK